MNEQTNNQPQPQSEPRQYDELDLLAEKMIDAVLENKEVNDEIKKRAEAKIGRPVINVDGDMDDPEFWEAYTEIFADLLERAKGVQERGVQTIKKA
jgi:hypothetical protein